MEQKKWFILDSQQKVSGPFLQEEIEGKLPQLNTSLIWGRGQSEWLGPDKWKKHLRELDENIRKYKSQNERLWKIRVGTQELKPLLHDQMMEFLKTRHDLSEIKIWTEGYSEWKDIYQIHKLMDELGVSRRQHPRVPIMGTVVMEGASSSNQSRALSISEGGLGVTDAPQVRIGEKFKIILKSSNLFNPLHATAEVVYVGTDGYAGLKFIGLHSESKSAIIEYVKKFTELKN
ncbi:MAG: PilZ domain-containing protein [Pseudobdellovibrionaceae bacterium]